MTEYTDAYTDDTKSFVFEAMQMRLLYMMMLRLAEDRPLNGDQRRDLANAMNAVLGGAVEMTTANIELRSEDYIMTIDSRESYVVEKHHVHHGKPPE